MPWWPCFVCDAMTLCGHREPELAVFLVRLTTAERAAVIAAAAQPERKAPGRETGRQRELFPADPVRDEQGRFAGGRPENWRAA